MAQAATWTPANAVTLGRIALVPIFAWTLLEAADDDVAWRLVSTGLFVLAALTDRLDGHLARSRGEVTPLGVVLDPIADKLLVGAALVLLSTQDRVAWWVTVVILGREVGITLWRFALLRSQIVPASRGGKVKTVVQSVAIGLLLLPLTHLPVVVARVADVVLWLAVAITVATGADYLVRGVRARRAQREVAGT